MAILAFFFLAGYLNGFQSQDTPDSPHHITTHVNEGAETIVICKVQRVFGFNGRTSKFDAKISARRIAGAPFEPASGMIRYTLEGILPGDITPGKTYAIRAKLRKPQKYGTPGSFDYPAYLASQHIYVTGFISSSLYVRRIHEEPSLLQGLLYIPEVLRLRINGFIDSNLEGEQAAVYKALLTGDRSSISNELRKSFKESGCLHILAISGIHMSLLGVLLFTCFFWLLRRSTWIINRINTKKTAACLCIVPLLFYTFIAGVKTPVFRSFIMSVIVIFAICYGKKHSFASLVSLAALLILLLSPTDLATASFQLTFAAVISIACAVPLLIRINSRLRDTLRNQYVTTVLGWIIAGMGVSLAATLGTAPLLIYHFNMISLVGVLANLIVEPLICLWSLIIGFFATGFIFIFPPLASFLFFLGGIGISMAIDATSFFSSLPYSSLTLPTVSFFQVFFYYLGLAMIILSRKTAKKYLSIALVLFPLIITSMVVPVEELTKGLERESTLSYLDVGHGSCTLIESPGGKRILVDGGALSSPGFDIGERVIAPFLLNKRIRHIDDIVVTHSDSDHYNGIFYILQNFRVERLWVNSIRRDEGGWRQLLDIADSVGTQVLVPQSNKVIARNAVMSMQVIANTTNTTGLVADNDNGLIVKYRHGKLTALFPGDISSEIEQKLVHADMSLKAEILLAAHHGSDTSNSDSFLDTVQPAVMIVSSGKNRAFAFPSASVTARCRKRDIPVISTNTAGTVIVRTRNGRYFTETFYPDFRTKDSVSR